MIIMMMMLSPQVYLGRRWQLLAEDEEVPTELTTCQREEWEVNNRYVLVTDVKKKEKKEVVCGWRGRKNTNLHWFVS